MSNIHLLKTICDKVYNPDLDCISTINQYFHPDYHQCINGIDMDLSNYIQHVIEQRKNIIIEFIEYKTYLEKDNELFAIYIPKGKDKQNNSIEAEVIAYIRFKGQQIDKIHGQVRLIHGNLNDVDM